MKKKRGKGKQGLQLTINLTNRWLYTLIAIGILAILGVGVYAYIGNVGHTSDQIDEVDPTVNDYIRDKESCVAITGSADLCDGSDAVGGADGYNPDNQPTASVRGEPTRAEIESWGDLHDDYIGNLCICIQCAGGTGGYNSGPEQCASLGSWTGWAAIGEGWGGLQSCRVRLYSC